MGINLEKMKATRDALENRGGQSAFWRPEDGDNNIRIVPTADGDPFKEYWFHYNLGKNPGFLCPKKNYNKAIEQFSEALKKYKRAKISEHAYNYIYIIIIITNYP